MNIKKSNTTKDSIIPLAPFIYWTVLFYLLDPKSLKIQLQI